jgi:hypothetical protein
MGKCAIVGCEALDIDYERQQFSVRGSGIAIHAGEAITLDGATGEVFRGQIATIDPDPETTLQKIGPWIQQFPATSFFVMSETIEASLIMDAMHLGVKDFITLPINRCRNRPKSRIKRSASIRISSASDSLSNKDRVSFAVPPLINKHTVLPETGCSFGSIQSEADREIPSAFRWALMTLACIAGGNMLFIGVSPTSETESSPPRQD